MANRVEFLIIAKDAFSRIGKKVTTVTKKMRKQFKGLKLDMSGLKSKFAGLATAAGAFFGARKFLETGMKFEDTIADLSAITGAAGKDLAFLSDEALRLAKVSHFSAAQTADAFKLIASAKDELLEDPKALSKVTESVLLLANASGVELNTAATVVTESLNQFGASAEEAGRFVNILAAGAKFGASEVEDTGPAVIKAGVAARMAKLSFEELNAAFQVLAKGGIKGVIAGTQLKTALIKLEAQGIRRIKPSVVGFEKALDNLRKMNLSTARMSKLFGLESINTGAILVNSSKAVGEFTRKLTGTSVASDQAAVRMSTFSTRVKSLGIDVEEKLIRTFNKLEDQKIFTNLAKDFGVWVDTISAEDILKVVEALKLMAQAVHKIGIGLAVVIDQFKTIGESMGEFTAKVENFEVLNVGKDLASFAKKLNPFSAIGDMAAELTGGGGTSEIEKSVTGVKSEADVQVTLTAPEGVVKSVKSTAKSPGLNVGVNMNTAAGAM